MQFSWIYILCLLSAGASVAQKPFIEFGTETAIENLAPGATLKGKAIQWKNVNTDTSTWKRKNELLVCSGLPIGVMRSAKQYENFILEVEWRHMTLGGNSGVFVWSDAKPGEENRLPGGVEVQMLELDWVNQNIENGITPPIAYVHGELFGVGGV
ncbi:MAG: family 16 glycoside hydrolase, partial [Flavitalea sp.]